MSGGRGFRAGAPNGALVYHGVTKSPTTERVFGYIKVTEHPIHLHGLWSELENGNGELRPYKHTINVKGGERLSYLVSADTPGRWAYHCHLLYHMDSGMFRAVIVS